MVKNAPNGINSATIARLLYLAAAIILILAYFGVALPNFWIAVAALVLLAWAI